MTTKIRYIFEAAFLRILMFIFKLLPPEIASNTGGWIGRSIGPKMGASRKAMRNLEKAMPSLDKSTRDTIISDMWDNLGRLIAEYPHLEILARDYTKIEGLQHLQPYIDGKRSAIFIGGHFANFEIPALCAFLQHGLAIDSTYRAPNNPYVHDMLSKTRSLDGQLQAHSKSKSGGRALMKAVKDGRNIGILIDQKYNEGIEVPFMGRDAMTNPVFVQLAQKYGHDIVPIHTVRDHGCHFRFIVDAPIAINKDEPVESVIANAHIVLEEWIREHPGQWLWLHRRWKDMGKD